MKLEIEITEDEIRSAIERKIRVAVADESNSYVADRYIKEQVKKQWASVVDRIISEVLENSEAIRAKVHASIEAKMKAQITTLMRTK